MWCEYVRWESDESRKEKTLNNDNKNLKQNLFFKKTNFRENIF